MFLDIANFKKELKRSYKGRGVKVIHYANDIIEVTGSGWIIQVHEKDMTKKFLSAVVELIGPLPKAGTGYEYRDKIEKEPLDLEEGELEPGLLLMNLFVAGKEVQDTRIMIQRFDRCYSVFQRIDTMEPLLIRRTKQVMVDPSKVENSEGELAPGAPVIAREMVIWNNDTMQLAITATPYHNEGEHSFLKLIHGKDMCWEFED